MNNDTPSLDSWVFEDIETALRAYAESINVVYDKTHPVACLPEGSTQFALRQLGMTYADVANMVSTGYQTVAGWFNVKRNPARSTVRCCIYPVLCEACRRSMSIHIDSDDQRRLVEHRVFLLLTTGSTDTPEEIQLILDQARERFHRSALIYAARTLNNSDLTSIAHSALGFLALNHGNGEYDSSINWEIARDSNLITMRGAELEASTQAESFDRATSIIDRESWTKGLETLSLEQLKACAKEIEDAIQEKEQAVT